MRVRKSLLMNNRMSLKSKLLASPLAEVVLQHLLQSSSPECYKMSFKTKIDLPKQDITFSLWATFTSLLYE